MKKTGPNSNSNSNPTTKDTARSPPIRSPAPHSGESSTIKPTTRASLQNTPTTATTTAAQPKSLWAGGSLLSATHLPLSNLDMVKKRPAPATSPSPSQSPATTRRTTRSSLRKEEEKKDTDKDKDKGKGKSKLSDEMNDNVDVPTLGTRTSPRQRTRSITSSPPAKIQKRVDEIDVGIAKTRKKRHSIDDDDDNVSGKIVDKDGDADEDEDVDADDSMDIKMRDTLTPRRSTRRKTDTIDETRKKTMPRSTITTSTSVSTRPTTMSTVSSNSRASPVVRRVSTRSSLTTSHNIDTLPGGKDRTKDIDELTKSRRGSILPSSSQPKTFASTSASTTTTTTDITLTKKSLDDYDLDDDSSPTKDNIKIKTEADALSHIKTETMDTDDDIDEITRDKKRAQAKAQAQAQIEKEREREVVKKENMNIKSENKTTTVNNSNTTTQPLPPSSLSPKKRTSLSNFDTSMLSENTLSLLKGVVDTVKQLEQNAQKQQSALDKLQQNASGEGEGEGEDEDEFESGPYKDKNHSQSQSNTHATNAANALANNRYSFIATQTAQNVLARQIVQDADASQQQQQQLTPKTIHRLAIMANNPPHLGANASTMDHNNAKVNAGSNTYGLSDGYGRIRVLPSQDRAIAAAAATDAYSAAIATAPNLSQFDSETKQNILKSNKGRLVTAPKVLQDSFSDDSLNLDDDNGNNNEEDDFYSEDSFAKQSHPSSQQKDLRAHHLRLQDQKQQQQPQPQAQAQAQQPETFASLFKKWVMYKLVPEKPADQQQQQHQQQQQQQQRTDSLKSPPPSYQHHISSSTSPTSHTSPPISPVGISIPSTESLNISVVRKRTQSQQRAAAAATSPSLKTDIPTDDLGHQQQQQRQLQPGYQDASYGLYDHQNQGYQHDISKHSISDTSLPNMSDISTLSDRDHHASIHSNISNTSNFSDINMSGMSDLSNISDLSDMANMSDFSRMYEDGDSNDLDIHHDGINTNTNRSYGDISKTGSQSSQSTYDKSGSTSTSTKSRPNCISRFFTTFKLYFRHFITTSPKLARSIMILLLVTSLGAAIYSGYSYYQHATRSIFCDSSSISPMLSNISSGDFHGLGATSPTLLAINQNTVPTCIPCPPSGTCIRGDLICAPPFERNQDICDDSHFVSLLAGVIHNHCGRYDCQSSSLPTVNTVMNSLISTFQVTFSTISTTFSFLFQNILLPILKLILPARMIHVLQGTSGINNVNTDGSSKTLLLTILSYISKIVGIPLYVLASTILSLIFPTSDSDVPNNREVFQTELVNYAYSLFPDLPPTNLHSALLHFRKRALLHPQDLQVVVLTQGAPTPQASMNSAEVIVAATAAALSGSQSTGSTGSTGNLNDLNTMLGDINSNIDNMFIASDKDRFLSLSPSRSLMCTLRLWITDPVHFIVLAGTVVLSYYAFGKYMTWNSKRIYQRTVNKLADQIRDYLIERDRKMCVEVVDAHRAFQEASQPKKQPQFGTNYKPNTIQLERTYRTRIKKARQLASVFVGEIYHRFIRIPGYDQHYPGIWNVVASILTNDRRIKVEVDHEKKSYWVWKGRRDEREKKRLERDQMDQKWIQDHNNARLLGQKFTAARPSQMLDESITDMNITALMDDNSNNSNNMSGNQSIGNQSLQRRPIGGIGGVGGISGGRPVSNQQQQHQHHQQHHQQQQLYEEEEVKPTSFFSRLNPLNFFRKNTEPEYEDENMQEEDTMQSYNNTGNNNPNYNPYGTQRPQHQYPHQHTQHPQQHSQHSQQSQGTTSRPISRNSSVTSHNRSRSTSNASNASVQTSSLRGNGLPARPRTAGNLNLNIHRQNQNMYNGPGGNINQRDHSQQMNQNLDIQSGYDNFQAHGQGQGQDQEHLQEHYVEQDDGQEEVKTGGFFSSLTSKFFGSKTPAVDVVDDRAYSQINGQDTMNQANQANQYTQNTLNTQSTHNVPHNNPISQQPQQQSQQSQHHTSKLDDTLFDGTDFMEQDISVADIALSQMDHDRPSQPSNYGINTNVNTAGNVGNVGNVGRNLPSTQRTTTPSMNQGTQRNMTNLSSTTTTVARSRSSSIMNSGTRQPVNQHIRVGSVQRGTQQRPQPHAATPSNRYQPTRPARTNSTAPTSHMTTRKPR